MKNQNNKVSTNYHHGNLRKTLIKEAIKLISEKGVSGLKVRELGERIGVSRTALYRHFQNKADLLIAIALEGFQIMLQEFQKTEMGDHSPQEQIKNLGDAYLTFAFTHPEYYRLMFGQEISSIYNQELCDLAPKTLKMIEDTLDKCKGLNLLENDTSTLARYLWANMHGYAMLYLDKQLPDDSATEAFLELNNYLFFG